MRIGECFRGSRYVVHRKLGWGHFSTVWLCWDSDGQREVALKVQKSAKNYTEAAYDEIRILEQIESGEAGDGTGKPAAESEEEPHGRTSADFSAGKLCALTLLDHFEHRGPNGTHVCMVFEVLGDNLLSLIKRFGYRGIPMTAVREIARQVLLGLDYLHTHLRIIHTDLKPENVLLVDPIEWHKPLDPNADFSAWAPGGGGQEAPSVRPDVGGGAMRAATQAANGSSGGNGSCDGGGTAAADVEAITEGVGHVTITAEDLGAPSDAGPREVASVVDASDSSVVADSATLPALTKNQKKKAKKKKKSQRAKTPPSKSAAAKSGKKTTTTKPFQMVRPIAHNIKGKQKT